jgi:chemotaxis protein MotA
MERKSILGLVICFAVFMVGFTVQGHPALYFNLAGLLIVLGGTAGATLISFRIRRLEILWKVLRATFRSRVKEPEEMVEILVDLSVKKKLKGLLSLQEDEEETSILFLRRSLGLLVDGYSREQIREALNTEMVFFRIRREDSERVLRAMAEMCPSFGLVGSVVGLIGMLGGIGVDTSTVLSTVPIALTSTLYGVVFANFFFLPFASSIRERTDRELLLQKIILEGIIAMGSELNPRVLEMKLKSFLKKCKASAFPAACCGVSEQLSKSQNSLHFEDSLQLAAGF